RLEGDDDPLPHPLDRSARDALGELLRLLVHLPTDQRTGGTTHRRSDHGAARRRADLPADDRTHRGPSRRTDPRTALRLTQRRASGQPGPAEREDSDHRRVRTYPCIHLPRSLALSTRGGRTTAAADACKLNADQKLSPLGLLPSPAVIVRRHPAAPQLPFCAVTHPGCDRPYPSDPREVNLMAP